MTDQLELVPTPPTLTPRQQAALDYIASHDGVPAAEIGAHLHNLRGRHTTDGRCEWCQAEGLDVVRSKALRQLVTYRKTSEGRLYLLRDRGARHPDDRNTQRDQLPGTTFEDIFRTPGEAA